MSTHAAGSRQTRRKFPNLRIRKNATWESCATNQQRISAYPGKAGRFSFLESDARFAKLLNRAGVGE
jgi:hypothetical protein